MKLKFYKLTEKDLETLEEKLRKLEVPGFSNDILDLKPFALAKAVPEIIKDSENNLANRLESSEFKKGERKKDYDIEKATTYCLLFNLSARQLFGYYYSLVENIRTAEDRLQRFLESYAPGGLSDTKGKSKGRIDATFIHQMLSSFLTPKGLTADVDIKHDYHTTDYGEGKPINIPKEVGIELLAEAGEQLYDTRKRYFQLVSTIMLIAELCGYNFDIDKYINEKTSEVNTQVKMINSIVTSIIENKDIFKTEEGIRKLVALRNNLAHLIKDFVPDDKYPGFAEYVGSEGKIFFNKVGPYFPTLPFSLIIDNAPIAVHRKYFNELTRRKNLSGAIDLLPNSNFLKIYLEKYEKLKPKEVRLLKQ